MGVFSIEWFDKTVKKKVKNRRGYEKRLLRGLSVYLSYDRDESASRPSLPLLSKYASVSVWTLAAMSPFLIR